MLREFRSVFPAGEIMRVTRKRLRESGSSN
jgi:hypothetical protein